MRQTGSDEHDARHRSLSFFCELDRITSGITRRKILEAGSVVETGVATIGLGALAIRGTSVCLGATAGNPACGMIGVTVGSTSVGGGIATFKEAQHLISGG